MQKIGQRKPGKKRIMVQLWGSLATAIDRNLKSLHLKRDSYLNELFASEIERLAEEITFRNSDAVRERLRNRALPNKVKVNLELDEKLVNRIDEVLRERNIPRDSFVNRVLFFLVAKEPHLRSLGVDYEHDWKAGAKPLQDARGFLQDPFFHIRCANDDQFYSIAWFRDGAWGKDGPNLFALNTAISDEDWADLNAPDPLLEFL
jgi:hypothetical protein